MASVPGERHESSLTCGGGNLVYASEAFAISVSPACEIEVHPAGAAVRQSETVALQKRILALESQESRAISYDGYYTEKLAQGRISQWAPPPSPAGTRLPHPLRDVEKLPRGGGREVVKPFWKTLVLHNQLTKGLANAYEIANLGVNTPDVFFSEITLTNRQQPNLLASVIAKAQHGQEHQDLSLDKYALCSPYS